MDRATISLNSAQVLCSGVTCVAGRAAKRVRHRALAGARLCRLCRDILATQLASLPDLYDECGRRLDCARQPGYRVSGGPMPGLPFNTAASEVRAAILGVLGSWAGMAAQERRITPPERSARALAGFLGRHVDWMAGHDTAAEITYEVADLVKSARGIAYPEHLRRVKIGACVEAECDGELVALVRQGRPISSAEIKCDVDPSHRWADRQWVQLSSRMRERSSRETAQETVPTRWLSAADISRLWRVASGSVYRLASERQWRRQSQAGRTYYHEADVQQTFEGRASI